MQGGSPTSQTEKGLIRYPTPPKEVDIRNREEINAKSAIGSAGSGGIRSRNNSAGARRGSNEQLHPSQVDVGNHGKSHASSGSSNQTISDGRNTSMNVVSTGSKSRRNSKSGGTGSNTGNVGSSGGSSNLGNVSAKLSPRPRGALSMDSPSNRSRDGKISAILL